MTGSISVVSCLDESGRADVPITLVNASAAAVEKCMMVEVGWCT